MDTPQFEGARIAHTLADGNATALARAEYADAKARLLRRRRAVEANAETRVVYAVASSDHASSSKRHQEATAHATEAAGALSDCLSTHMLWEAAGLASGAVGRYASTDAAPLTIAASSVAALLRRHEMVQTTYSAASQAERALADRLGDMASFPHIEGNASTGVGDAAHLQLAVAARVPLGEQLQVGLDNQFVPLYVLCALASAARCLAQCRCNRVIARISRVRVRDA